VRERGHEALVSDGLATGFQSDRFVYLIHEDFGISIAVIHHFSTPERRLQAVKELLRIIKPGGTLLIFVWAMEQEKNSKRRFETQDEMVSWKTKQDGQEVVYHRYYHLFFKGELDELCIKAGGEVLESGYDRDNHYVILRK
jgi:tRNA (uracil-5-)-methyltransferase TRM9